MRSLELAANNLGLASSVKRWRAEKQIPFSYGAAPDALPIRS